MSSDDTVHVGASSTSPPRPSPQPTVYRPFEVPGAFEMELHKKVTSIINRLDLIKVKLELNDEVVQAILEGEDVSDGELLKWWKAHKEQLKELLTKEYNKIS